MNTHQITVTSAIAVSMAAISIPSAIAATPAEFYKGKQVTFVVPAGSGGSYGRYSQLGKKALEKFMPGVTIVMQYMPGSGGIKATNYIANVAPRDGSVIYFMTAGAPQSQLFTPKRVKFDIEKIPFIGQFAPLPSIIAVRSDAPATSLEGAKKIELSLAASGFGSQQHQVPTLLNLLVGTKFKIIAGYKGSGRMFHAIEGNEVHGVLASTVSWAAIKPGWVEKKFVTPMFQTGKKAARGYEGVPLIEDVTTNKEHRQMLRAATSGSLMGRSVSAVPGFPKDKLKYLRDAFRKGMHDPEMLAFAKKTKLSVDYHSGEEMEALVREIMSTPKSVVDKLKKVLNIKG